MKDRFEIILIQGPRDQNTLRLFFPTSLQLYIMNEESPSHCYPPTLNVVSIRRVTMRVG
jgi:hypothetical protein